MNLNGVFHCAQAFLPLLRERGGQIITIVSTTAVLVSPGGGSHYCATRSASARGQACSRLRRRLRAAHRALTTRARTINDTDASWISTALTPKERTAPEGAAYPSQII